MNGGWFGKMIRAFDQYLGCWVGLILASTVLMGWIEKMFVLYRWDPEKEMFVTKNLKEFCKEHRLKFGSMQHNARTRKTICNDHWSCRKGEMIGEVNNVILLLENEYAISAERAKRLMSQRNKQGENNPMYGKKHTEETKRKIQEAKRHK